MAQQVPRHPSVFEGAPIVEGYRLVPAPVAPFYFRAASEALKILARYNVTTLTIELGTCSFWAPNGEPVPYWTARITAENPALGARIVRSTPLNGPARLWDRLEPVEGINLSAIDRVQPDPTLEEIAEKLDIASRRLMVLAYQGRYYTGVNSLSPGVSIVVSLTGWTPDPVQVVAAALDRAGVRVEMTFYTLAILNMTPESVTSTTLWFPCRPIDGGDLLGLDVPPSSLAPQTVNTSGAGLVLEPLAATPGNLTVGGARLVVAKVPAINPDFLSAAAARGILGALEPINQSISPPGEPPINVTIEEIRAAITNGSELEALQAIREAQNMAEEGAISPQDLEELRRLFIERFGYDPLQAQDTGTGGQGGQGQGGSSPTDVLIDINNILNSLQSLTGGQASPMTGPGTAQLPGISVSLPGAQQALTAALLASMAAAAGILYTNRREIVFTARALTAKPPGGLTPRETAEWCYAAALRVLEIRGLGRHPWETPREHLKRVAPNLGQIAQALEKLVNNYEKAVYRGENPPRGETIRACRHLIRTIRNPLWKPQE